MRCKATLQIEVPTTRDVAIDDDRSDTIDVGTRLVDVEVTAEVAYDSVKDDYSLTGHEVVNPHGWSWGDLADEQRTQLEDELCWEAQRRQAIVDSASERLDAAMARVGEMSRKLDDVLAYEGSTTKAAVSALWAYRFAVHEALRTHGTWFEARHDQ